jgi:spermidine/putrescine transport system ATP-binding protein
MLKRLRSQLYTRPEHARLVATQPDGLNSIPVTVSDVTFEGNFINILVADRDGRTHTVQARNDGATAVPAPGAKLLMAFEPDRAIVLTDETPATAGLRA